MCSCMDGLSLTSKISNVTVSTGYVWNLIYKNIWIKKLFTSFKTDFSQHVVDKRSKRDPESVLLLLWKQFDALVGQLKYVKFEAMWVWQMQANNCNNVFIYYKGMLVWLAIVHRNKWQTFWLKNWTLVYFILVFHDDYIV